MNVKFPPIRQWLSRNALPTRRWMLPACASVLCAAAATAGVRAAYQASAPAPREMAAMLPQGALLTIEASNFASLLKHWDDSPEKAAWLKSDDASEFSQSRIYGRLGDAQKEFARAAGLPPDRSFLNEVAGSHSIFAWYDIGNLEFLYITQLPAGGAAQTRLMQLRGKFSTRQVGGQTFYVRTVPDPAGRSVGPAAVSDTDASPYEGQQRTVAFATSGDWLLLATRENLMATALTLISEKDNPALTANPQSPIPLTKEPWYAEAQSAVAKDRDGPGELHMTLNLEKIARTPYFRSYWVQRNVTETRQFRSAVADLHMEQGSFREERVLLPAAAESLASSEPDPQADGHAGNLAALTALLPERYATYRASAAPTVDAALASLDEKLLQRGTSSVANFRSAPDADLSVPLAGSGSEFDRRIDAADPMVASEPVGQTAAAKRAGELAPLHQALAGAGLDAMMTVSRTGPAAQGIWVPFHSAVVLAADRDWDSASLQSAVQMAVRSRLTASGLGLDWKPVKGTPGDTPGVYMEISSLRPLELAVQGHICILADDPGLMAEMLGKLKQKSIPKPDPATLLAGFHPAEERDTFARWTSPLDHPANGGNSGPGNQPAFFANNMLSLVDTFAALQSETMAEYREGPLTRQTVVYAWKP